MNGKYQGTSLSNQLSVYKDPCYYLGSYNVWSLSTAISLLYEPFPKGF